MALNVKNSQKSGSEKQVVPFSSPEPLGLICNRPRDQETKGSGEENAKNKTQNTEHEQAYIK